MQFTKQKTAKTMAWLSRKCRELNFLNYKNTDRSYDLSENFVSKNKIDILTIKYKPYIIK